MRNTIALAGLIVAASLLGGCAGGLTGGSMLPSAQNLSVHHLNTTGGGPPVVNPDNTTGGGPPVVNPDGVVGGGPPVLPNGVVGGGPPVTNPNSVTGGGPAVNSVGGQSRIRHKH